MKVLMVLTSHNLLGDTGKPTGFWLEEFTAPYYVFKDAGAEITVASPKGGQPPIDPKSDEPGNQTESMARFKDDVVTPKVLANTISSPTSRQATTTPSSIPAAMARCGIWSMTKSRSH